ncbi:hypothetical protein IC575_022688 [Cucumis melo]
MHRNNNIFDPKCMGTSSFFLLLVVSLFSFHFGLSNAASFDQVHKNGLFTDSLDDNNDYWAFAMNPNTFSSSIWIGKRCNFDGSVCNKCRTGDCSDGDGDRRFLQKQAFVDKGGGSLFRWRFYANDVAKYVSNKLNNNIQSRYSLVKLLLFEVV